MQKDQYSPQYRNYQIKYKHIIYLTYNFRFGFYNFKYDNKAERDIDATREWLSKTRDVSSWDDEKVKTANTGTHVFVRANIQIQDAIEDLNFNIYIE